MNGEKVALEKQVEVLKAKIAAIEKQERGELERSLTDARQLVKRLEKEMDDLTGSEPKKRNIRRRRRLPY